MPRVASTQETITLKTAHKPNGPVRDTGKSHYHRKAVEQYPIDDRNRREDYKWAACGSSNSPAGTPRSSRGGPPG